MCSHPQLEGETASSGTFVPVAPEQRPQVSREVRLLEGARGADIWGAHQEGLLDREVLNQPSGSKVRASPDTSLFLG